jgi:hypothetical protein
MATRRIDVEKSLGSEHVRPERARDNTITGHSLEPTRRSPGATTGDPSPFSRPRAVDPAVEQGDSRHERIAHAAYRRAEARGFEPGHELEDWLAAEREIDERLGDH